MAKKKKTAKETFDRNYWTAEELDILRAHRDHWLSEKTGLRRTTYELGTVAIAIAELNPAKYGSEAIEKDAQLKDKWLRCCKAIGNWFNNHRKTDVARRVLKMERKLPLRQVIGHFLSDQVGDRVHEWLPDEAPGSRTYFSHWQKALTELIAKLPTAELEKYKEIRTVWQQNGPSPEVQQRMADKHGLKAVKEFHEICHKQMGMNLVTASWHTLPDGRLGIYIHDHVSRNLGHGNVIRTFREFNPEGFNRLSENILAYSSYVKNQRMKLDGNGPGMDNDGPQSLRLVPAVVYNDDGVPLLPPPTIGPQGKEIGKDLIPVVRTFYNLHWALATGQKSAKVPWDWISKDPNQFFDARYLPVGFKFCDPSRMGTAVKELATHLRKIQDDDNEVKFHFRNILEKNKVCPAVYPEKLSLAFKGRSRRKGKARERSPGLQLVNGSAFDQMFLSPAKSTITASPSPQKLVAGAISPTTTIDASPIQQDGRKHVHNGQTSPKNQIGAPLPDALQQYPGIHPFGFPCHPTVPPIHTGFHYEPGPPQVHNGFTAVNPQTNSYHAQTNGPMYQIPSSSFTFPIGAQDPNGHPVQYPLYPGHSMVNPPSFDSTYHSFPINHAYPHGFPYGQFRTGLPPGFPGPAGTHL